MKKLIAFIFLVFIGFSVIAQESDTLKLDSVPNHSPKKATLLSLAVPGLGQAYNKKYWKIPLVYAIIGTPLYFALEEAKLYNEFKDAYVAEQLGETHKYTDVYNGTQLNALLQGHRQNRDLFVVLTVAAYAMNILDAAVDAHLYSFDVSDDLSASFKPSFQLDRISNTMIPSMTLSLKFVKKSQRNAF
jgi:hypothetical protein